MGLYKNLALVICAIFLYVVVYPSYKKNPPIETETLLDQWWGTGHPKDADTSIRPFKINVSDKVLNDLKSRLENVKLLPPLKGVNFEYGFNTNALKDLLDYWLTKYHWKEREAYLNKFQHFITNIQGLDIHYVHIKPKTNKNTKVLPIIMIHGWPSSFTEFLHVIPEMAAQKPGYDFVFELIIPSIPGFGFSHGATKPGLGYPETAAIFRLLMNRLGFKKYYIHGGDFGVLIGHNMGHYFPNEVLGHHSNLCHTFSYTNYLKVYIASLIPRLFIAKEHEHKIFPVNEYYKRVIAKTGYVHFQMTRPDTVGVALHDSPAGMAAYILDKFVSWTNEKVILQDAGMKNKFSYEKLLDNVMIYYVTNTIGTSMRYYAEYSSFYNGSAFQATVTIPMACAKFPDDPLYYFDWQLRGQYENLIQSTDLPRGGHFPGYEQPQDLMEDIFSAVDKFEIFHKKKANNKLTDEV